MEAPCIMNCYLARDPLGVGWVHLRECGWQLQRLPMLEAEALWEQPKHCSQCATVNSQVFMVEGFLAAEANHGQGSVVET